MPDFFLISAQAVVQNVAVFLDQAHANSFATIAGETAILRAAQSPMPNIGDTVNASTGAWVSSPAVVKPPTILSINGFLELFTAAELAGIYASANGAVQAVRAMLAQMPNGSLSLADPMVIGWINGLVSLSLLTAPRAAAILAT